MVLFDIIKKYFRFTTTKGLVWIALTQTGYANYYLWIVFNLYKYQYIIQPWIYMNKIYQDYLVEIVMRYKRYDNN